jgi:5-methyltetrahydrofolate--homocysteine methyltransferase
MFEHLGSRAKLLVLVVLAFAFGLGLGRGMGGVRQGSGPELASRQPAVIQAGLESLGGRCVVNSVNFEDGYGPESRYARVMPIIREHGAAVVVMCIDEEGQARTAEWKVRAASRIIDDLVGSWGMTIPDIFVDALTFPISTGQEETRKDGIETIEAIRALAQRYPGINFTLGISNVSFGLNPAARQVLNSVFLHECQQAGLTSAIVHASKILPMQKTPQEQREVALDLVYDRRREGYDPLQRLIEMFEGVDAASARASRAEELAALPLAERLARRIVDGERNGLEADLDAALQERSPLDIINDTLLAGMKTVGELFGSGQMQLPFVLQSAEVMKTAVAYLEPHLEKADAGGKGRIVLATVKGDVHDIGKNLVDIILSNNGYEVVNIGIKQPINAILDAAEELAADAIGMSGLLVKSTVIMRDNLDEMHRMGLDVPVLLGGAALTRQFVEDDCAKVYGGGEPGRVAYARDAFDGLKMMDLVKTGGFDPYLQERQETQAKKPKRKKPQRTLAYSDEELAKSRRPVDVEEVRLKRNELSKGVQVPTPPFWGARVIEKVDVRALLPYLNENMLYQFHWGYKKEGRSLAAFLAWAQKELRPVLAELIERAEAESVFAPTAAYGYWRAAAEGNDVILFDTDGATEVARFSLPRQDRPQGLCIADFLRDVSEPERDVIALQVVTVGQRASEVAREWFAQNRYNDYVRLHGLGVELAEALAEYVHRRIRAELGFAHLDARDMAELLRQGYRGSRYSFGYPACPNLADQKQLLALLGAERVGVELGEEDQLWPEQSTSAIVVHHPQARYFNV